jgi:tetratricopeptide (TPR) repeat protein
VKEGINEYRRHLGRIEIVDVREAWDRFPPVPLPRADFVWEEEERVLAEGRLREEIVRFKRYREEQFNLVVVSLRNRVKKSPDNPLLHNRLGIILGREGRYDLAEREFEDILKGNKTHPSALNNLGNIHLLRTSVDEAISFYREAVRSDPQDPAILFNLGLAFFIKGEMEAALEMLGKSLSGFSNLDEAARTLGFSFEGMALSLTGSTKMSKEEVKRLLDEALSKIPEDMEGIKKKAKILFGVFAGTRGADISEEADLRWLLYWKG